MPKNKYDPIIVLNAMGKKTPMVFIHPGQGGAESYINFCKNFPADQPIYLIENYNLYHGNPYLLSIEEMAQQYIEYLLDKLPAGPYQLGGYCLGGLIAYEMALQLQQRGKTIDKLYLIDAFFHKDIHREKFIQIYEQKLTASLSKSVSELVNVIANYASAKYRAKILQCQCIIFKCVVSAAEDLTHFADKEWIEKHGINIEDIFDQYRDKKSLNGLEGVMADFHLYHIKATHDSILIGDSGLKVARAINKNLIAHHKKH